MSIKVRRGWRFAGVGLILAGLLVSPLRAARSTAQEERQVLTPNKSVAVSKTAITPVAGASTLHHLGRDIEGSTMGWAGQWSQPPAALPSWADGHLRSEPPGGPFVLTGADLYRISCRACHKPDGSGAPPEINSVTGPVHAASFEWMTDDMKARGRNLGAAFVRQLTTATEADLRTRLRQGGHDMPAFGQISDQEYAVLRPYLDAMAGVQSTRPGQGPRTITEPADRVGELLVKGTCHVCHDATQSNQRPTTVLNGVIPSLASLPRDKTFADFVHKVRAGAPVLLSEGGVMSRGRMPVFDYLTDAEVASAYSYLMTYPPR
jgi:mono/diheme cytochrome c family protein